MDPITKKPIEDPVKNKVCNHVYERSAIMNLIGMKSRVRCPGKLTPEIKIGH